MIRSFACGETEALFRSRAVARFRNIERVARRRKLEYQNALKPFPRPFREVCLVD